MHNERGSYDDSRSCAGRTVNAQVRLGTVVEHQHQGTADTAERVSNEPLVEAGGNALLCGDVLQAIISALADVLNNWLSACTWRLMSVCAAANVEASNNAGVVLPRVEFHDGVEGTELEATVRDDSCFGPYFGNIILTESLKDKLKACVGKYRMQFVKDSREGRGALLAVNARETIFDAGVARHRSVPDLRIGILGLKHKT